MRLLQSTCMQHANARSAQPRSKSRCLTALRNTRVNPEYKADYNPGIGDRQLDSIGLSATSHIPLFIHSTHNFTPWFAVP